MFDPKTADSLQGSLAVSLSKILESIDPPDMPKKFKCCVLSIIIQLSVLLCTLVHRPTTFK